MKEREILKKELNRLVKEEDLMFSMQMIYLYLMMS